MLRAQRLSRPQSDFNRQIVYPKTGMTEITSTSIKFGGGAAGSGEPFGAPFIVIAEVPVRTPATDSEKPVYSISSGLA